MIGRLVAYAARRVAGRAVDAVERQVVWIGLGVLLFLFAMVFGLVAGFVALERELGALTAALIVAGACAVLGLIGMWMPGFLSWIEQQAQVDQEPIAAMTETVEEEAQAAVDYLGPLQVAASAFMLGFTAARRIKRR